MTILKKGTIKFPGKVITIATSRHRHLNRKGVCLQRNFYVLD